MLYDCIVADPPWSFSDELKQMGDSVQRSAASQYTTMPLSDITAIDVKSIANPDGCLLALWVPSSMLQDGLNVMSAWGFKLKQTFIWVKLKKEHEKETDPNLKTRIAMGRLFRQCHEIALIGTSGKSIYKKLANKAQRSVSLDLNMGHSCKPETLQDRLEIMFPDAQKLEMFARRNRLNWTCLGNEIDGLDINTAVQNVNAL